MQIYWGSVGGNSSLLLNIPPNKQGLLAKADVRALRKFGNELRKEFPDNLMKDCVITVSSQIDDERNANNIITENGYWQCGENDEKPTIEITFNSSIVADKIVLKENIATGQQIESFEVFADSLFRLKLGTLSTIFADVDSLYDYLNSHDLFRGYKLA